MFRLRPDGITVYALIVASLALLTVAVWVGVTGELHVPVWACVAVPFALAILASLIQDGLVRHAVRRNTPTATIATEDSR